MVNDTFSLIIKLSNYIYCIARSDQAIKPKTYKVTVKASQHISENTKVYKQNEEKKLKKKTFCSCMQHMGLLGFIGIHNLICIHLKARTAYFHVCSYIL